MESIITKVELVVTPLCVKWKPLEIHFAITIFNEMKRDKNHSMLFKKTNSDISKSYPISNSYFIQAYLINNDIHLHIFKIFHCPNTVNTLHKKS